MIYSFLCLKVIKYIVLEQLHFPRRHKKASALADARAERVPPWWLNSLRASVHLIFYVIEIAKQFPITN